MTTAYEGSCHCGGGTFTYRTSLAPGEWNVRACRCSFCRAHGALSTSDPAGSLEFKERIRGALHRYRFGQLTADFLICRKCGVYVGATIDGNDGRYGILNVNALRPIPADLPPSVPATCDNESREERIERRSRRWTPLAGSV